MKLLKYMIMVSCFVFLFDLKASVDESMNQAQKDLLKITTHAIYSAIVIGCCSYIIDTILYNFEMTKNLECRGNLATISSISLYCLYFVSAEMEKKNKRGQEEELMIEDSIKEKVE